MTCQLCDELFQAGDKEEQDCEKCQLVPVLWEENELIFEIFVLLRASSPWGISCEGAETIFKWYRVPEDEKLELFENIMRCWNEEMKLTTKKENKRAGLI